MRNKGFTLAEVLVTLGIIGVVSAMTIPALMQNWQKKAYVTQLHKIYNIFEQALGQMLADTQASNLREAGFMGMSTSCGSNAHEKNFLHEHFKVVKDCGGSSGCFASSYRNLNGSTVNVQIDGHRVVIAGGSAVAFNVGSGTNPSYFLGWITVDTNGAKGPNIIGRDLFQMVAWPDGQVSDWYKNCSGSGCNTGRTNYFNSYCKNSNGQDWYLSSCFGKILNDNWEMNY